MQQFNIGDVVVSLHDFRRIKKHNILVISRIKVNNIFEQSLSFQNHVEMYYKSNCFITLIEYRKLKINKIKEKICLKKGI